MPRLENNDIVYEGTLNGSDCDAFVGTYADVLKQVDKAINARVGKELPQEVKGKMLRDAIQTLRTDYGLEVSTKWLKQFVTKGKNTTEHLRYIMNLAGLTTDSHDVKFKGGLNIRHGAFSRRDLTFDMVITKEAKEAKNGYLYSLAVKDFGDKPDFAECLVTTNGEPFKK